MPVVRSRSREPRSVLYTKSAGFAAGAISRSRRLRVGGRWLTPLRAHGSCESSGGIGLSGFFRAGCVFLGQPRLTHPAPRAHRIGNFGGEESNGPERIVVAWNHEVHFIRIAVGIDDP